METAGDAAALKLVGIPLIIVGVVDFNLSGAKH
jgi:hypothetical protein